MTDQKQLDDMVSALAGVLKARNLKLTTAESCTAGGVAYVLTRLSGSSEWFERGFVTYSNEAKHEMLGVRVNTLSTAGAVSEVTAKEMAEGALRHSHAQVSLAVTGIAGPGGGAADKPVGLVWFAWAGKGFPTLAKQKIFSGDREEVRVAAIGYVIEELLAILRKV